MVKNSFTILILIVFIFTNCHKDSDEFIIDNTIVIKEEGDIGLFYEEIEKPLEAFFVQATETNTLETTIGTTIIIPANSLLTQNGVPVKGEITVEVTEVEDRGDMIKLNRSMIIDNHMLESKATIYINFTVNGQQLTVAENVQLTISFQNLTESSNASVFFSDDNNTEWLPTNAATEANEGNLNMLIQQAGWYTYAYQLDPSPPFSGDIKVKLAANFSPANTVVYMVLKEYQSIVKLYFDENIDEFTTGPLVNVPVSSPIEIFAVSNRTSTTYFQGSITESIETPEIKLPMDLSEKPIPEIKELIDSL